MHGSQTAGRTIGPRLVALLIAVVATGCGPSRPTTVRVSGVVTSRGEPVEGATVTLTRGTGGLEGGETAFGRTDGTGRFELTTHFGPDTSATGAVPGEYKVTVSKLVPPRGITPAEYQAKVDAMKKAGESGAMVPAHLQPPPLVQQFPAHYSAAAATRLTATVPPGGTSDLAFKLD